MHCSRPDLLAEYFSLICMYILVISRSIINCLQSLKGVDQLKMQNEKCKT